MANRKFLFGLLVLILFVNLIECKGRGGGGSRSSGGRSKGGSHSSYGSSYSKSSSSWWSGWWGSSSGSSASSSRHSYPSSSTGLSGSSHGSSSSSSSHSYPSSSSGLSGSGTGKSSYPYSSTGLSGNNDRYPSWSGSGRNHHTASSKGNSINQYHTPTFYSAPQHVYVTEYRNSGSSYGDLLTGLTLYNLGRSHSHYNDHYYNDDFYDRRYSSSNSYNSHYNTYSKPQETAVCRLKIKDRDSVETLKIPCEIVSTFTEDSKKVSKENTVNTTVCVTKTTIVNSTSPSANVVVGLNTTLSTDGSNEVFNNTLSPEVTLLMPLIKNNITNSTSFANNTESMMNVTSASENIVNLKILKNTDPVTNKVSVLNTTINKTQEVQKQSVVNVTTCTTRVNTTDPLTVKGRPVDPSGKECIVEIQTRESLLSNNIDCSILMKYSKMPEPRKEESSLMPSRDKLKSWLSNPPWWMSAFIAV